MGVSRSRLAKAGVQTASALLVATTLAATAHALPDAGEQTGIDTRRTPVAKTPPEGMFALFGGTRYDGPEADPANLIEDSPTPFEAELLDVAFEKKDGDPKADETKAGFAGGTLEKADGTKVPVIYRHTDDDGIDVWEESARFEGRGYVAAITWLPGNRALAVGGDGSYPHRETTASYCEPGEPPPVEDDPAGEVRAWLYENGAWRELSQRPDGTQGDELPDEMGALTALDAYDNSGDVKGVEFAVAGGLCQLWHWREGGFMRADDGSFAEPFSPESPAHRLGGNRDIAGGPSFLYRVRAVTFQSESRPLIRASAITSGCCAPDRVSENDKRAAVLSYPGSDQGAPDAHPAEGTWSVSEIGDVRSAVGLVSPSLTDVEEIPDHSSVKPKEAIPDSFFAVTSSAKPGVANSAQVGVVATPGGRPAVPGAEPASIIGNPSEMDIGGPGFFANGINSRPPHIEVSSTRLLDGDGDSGGGTTSASASASPDGIPDWAVGELTSTGRAAAVSTYPAQLEEPPPAIEPPPSEAVVEELSEYEPTSPQRALAAVGSYQLLMLPTYRLNGFEMLDDHGIGWAVGRYGAVVKLRIDLKAVEDRLDDSEPPRLGVRRSEQLPDDSAYEEFRPQGVGAVGQVPPLASQPPEALKAPELRSSASAGRLSDEKIAAFVLSRDGSEGWAFGDSGWIYRLEGGEWRRCEAERVEGAFAPDPACEELAVLYEQGVPIHAAARIPFERDSDPTNDDEFEVVAAGGAYTDPETGKPTRTVARLVDGRWRLEDPDSSLSPPSAKELIFTAPDDGWAVTGDGIHTDLFHFDGERWGSCADAEFCGDAESRRLQPFSIAQRDWVITGLSSAGDRVYVAGYRRGRRGEGEGRTFPMIIHHERGRDGWSGDVEDGGYDPAHQSGPGEAPLDEQGAVDAISVLEMPDGGYFGWAAGRFDDPSSPQPLPAVPSVQLRSPTANFLRLDGDERWEKFRDSGALADRGSAAGARALTVAPGPAGGPLAVLGDRSGRLVSFNEERRRWELMEAPRLTGAGGVAGQVSDIASDATGGMWVSLTSPTHLFHLTAHPNQDVFREVPDPAAGESTVGQLAATPSGQVWLTANSDMLYRYDRVLGWTRIRVPGWDPGRIITAPSAVHALAIGETGAGLAVGPAGRIAELDESTVRLDDAAGTKCQLAAPQPPCGTSQDLLAAAVAPDGSAIVAGRNRSLLWRPAGGEFRSITWPAVTRTTDFVDLSMPTPDRAWLLTDDDVIYAGQRNGSGSWTWVAENLVADGQPSANGISDLELDADGRGFAVGVSGLVLARDDEADPLWRRLPTGLTSSLTAVALPEGGGGGALVGGRGGILLTYVDGRLRIARPPDANGTASIDALALVPGTEDGQVEAWAAIGDRDVNRLFHYASEPRDPLFEPARRGAQSLPDAPPPEPGELSFAALGKSDCSTPREKGGCGDHTGSSEIAQVVTERIRETILAGEGASRPAFAIFTGDAVDTAGLPASHELLAKAPPLPGSLTSGPVKLRSWVHRIADRFDDGGVPLFGGIGAQDHSEASVCDPFVLGSCVTNRQLAMAGDNLAWRHQMASRPAPWGTAEEPEADEYTFEAVDDPAEGTATGAQQLSDVELGDPSGGSLGEQKVSAGQGKTHYAVDVVRDGEPVARVVVLDSSLRSLAASDPLQQPLEPKGQMGFLERMICHEGGQSATGEECTRKRGQRAIVVSNTPTYSYGPGAVTDTATDAAAFEAVLLRHEVDVVVSGRLGWNGLYYALAPGLHWPCPGGEHPDGPPSGQLPDCTGSAGQSDPVAEAQRKAEELGVDSSLGALPFVVASGAGGKFGPDGRSQGSASEGFWHGYTIVRLHPSGDPAKTIVEQRPVYDWISIQGSERTLHARERMRLRGVGRGPMGVTLQPGLADTLRGRIDEIDSPAITHRYDLLLADPDQPWLPCDADDPDCKALHAKLSAEPGEPVALASRSSATPSEKNPCDPYLCLPERVAAVDRQTGVVKAGNGKYEQTFAIAMLSVDDKVATYPLVFKPSPSFVVTPFEGPPSIPANASPSAPPPPTLPKPQIPSLSLPTPPTLPAIPPLVAQAPPEPQPPAPPAPPPPAEQPSPLNLAVAPTGLTVATPTAVIQPPTPPVNPAPPGGARREARQRQAAAQKSGADNAEEGSQTQGMGGDLADAPDSPSGSQQMTRHDTHAVRRDRVKPGPSFTPLRRGDSAASGRAALYGGGLTLTALALALGFTTLRPRSRRREPDLPVPAWARGEIRRGP